MSTSKILHETKVMRRFLALGLFLVVSLVVGLGGWAAMASIEGAVLASGEIVQEGKNKLVQHDETGVIKTVHVLEGQLVHSGDLLISLDGTAIFAEREVLRKRIFEQVVKRKRLRTMRDGKKRFVLSKEFLKKNDRQVDLQQIITVQRNLFSNIQKQQQNKRLQLNERIGHLKKEIKGLDIQVASQRKEARLLDREINILRKLKRKRLTAPARYNQLLRDRTGTDAEVGRLQAAIARTKGQIIEANLQLIETTESFRRDALKELEQSEGIVLELKEKYLAANHRLKALEIKSPYTGYVHELKAHTLRGVVGAGEVLMQIVPKSKLLTVEARVQPRDIDQVKLKLCWCYSLHCAQSKINTAGHWLCDICLSQSQPGRGHWSALFHSTTGD